MKLCGLNTEESRSLNNDNVRHKNNEEEWKQRLARGRVRQCGGGLASGGGAIEGCQCGRVSGGGQLQGGQWGGQHQLGG